MTDFLNDMSPQDRARFDREEWSDVVGSNETTGENYDRYARAYEALAHPAVEGAAEVVRIDGSADTNLDDWHLTDSERSSGLRGAKAAKDALANSSRNN